MRGHITRRGDGYRVEIHLGYGPDGKRLRHRATLSTKKAAERYLRDKLEEFETEGSLRTRSLETLGDYLARWLEVCAQPRVRQRTFEDYTWVIGRHLTGRPLARKPLSTVSPADIQELYTSIMAGGTGPHGVRKLHAVLRQALQQAVKWRELTQNPALFVDLPRVKRKPELRILHAPDFPAFVQAALEEDRLGVLWVLALATGMRPEEYLGLQWGDFSPDSRRVTVNRVLVRPLKRVAGEPPWLSLAEDREEPAHAHDRADHGGPPPGRHHRAQQNQEKLAAGPAYDDHGLVFANELGAPLHLDNLRNRNLKRILERAGLPLNLTPYSLRHSAATALLKDRESLKVVSELLGHSTIRLTGDIYSHVTDDMLEEASAKLGKRMFG